jgi:hypothetical protein
MIKIVRPRLTAPGNKWIRLQSALPCGGPAQAYVRLGRVLKILLRSRRELGAPGRTGQAPTLR